MKRFQDYFGEYPIINFLSTEFLFRVIKHRKSSLLKRNSKKQGNLLRNIVLKNNEDTELKLRKYLEQGLDKLSIGGGKKNLEGFVNIDFISHKDVKEEIVANILDLSFIPDKSVSHIHSNHVIEHLSQEQLEHQLREYIRILKDDGIITIRCPNVLGVCYGFFFGVVPENDYEDFLALGYPKDEEFHNPKDSWYHKDLYGFIHWIYGDVGNITNQHLNQLTPSKIKDSLERIGFNILKMTKPETSNIIVVAGKRKKNDGFL